jgi:hypothetical protein
LNAAASDPTRVNRFAIVSAWARDSSSAVHSARIVPCTTSGGESAITRATQPARSSNSARGATSLTSPIWNARSADIRSCAPSSERRMISGNGIFESICMGSNAAVIP